MTTEMACACGCGTIVYPNMYVYRIAGRFYVQKCVRFGSVAALQETEPVTDAPQTAEIHSDPASAR